MLSAKSFVDVYIDNLKNLKKYETDISTAKTILLKSNNFSNDYFKNIVPIFYPKNTHFSEFVFRDAFINNFGWSLPTKNIIDTIISFCQKSIVLEVGAGLGLISKLIIESGIQLITTDSYEEYKDDTVRFMDIIKMDCVNAIDHYPQAQCLMLVWPKADVADNSIKKFKGNKIIYIGEDAGGCCAGQTFFDELEKRWTCKVLDMTTWPGMHDKLYLFTKIKTLSCTLV